MVQFQDGKADSFTAKLYLYTYKKMINFKETLEKLESSEEFKQFKKEHPHAFLTAGFFVIDNETGNEIKQLDYAITDGETKDLITFVIGDKIQHKKEETIKKEKFHRLEIPKIELNDAVEIMKKDTEKFTKQYAKIIAILQMLEHEEDKEGKKSSKLTEVWNLTGLAGFSMFRLHVDVMTGEIFKEENKNLLDIMRVEKKDQNYIG